MTTILANGENSCLLRNVTNYMGTLRKVKGVHPLMDKGFQPTFRTLSVTTSQKRKGREPKYLSRGVSWRQAAGN